MRGRKSAMRSRTQLSVLAALEGDDHDADPGRTHGRAEKRIGGEARPAGGAPRRVAEEALAAAWIHRGRVLPRRPLVEADLATGAPVQRATPGGWAGLNGLPLQRAARLAVAPYTAGPSATPGTVMCSRWSRLARSSLAALLTRRTASISAAPTVANGLRPARPEHLAAVHVADATEHVGPAAPRRGLPAGRRRRAAARRSDRGRRRRDRGSGPTPPRPGWRLASGMRNVPRERSVETHRLPPGDLDEHAHLVVRAHPRSPLR